MSYAARQILVLTKTDEEPTSLTLVGHAAGSLSRGNRPSIDTSAAPRYTRATLPIE